MSSSSSSSSSLSSSLSLSSPGCCIAALGWATAAVIAVRVSSAAYRIVYPYFMSAGVRDLAAFSGGRWAGEQL